MRKMQKNRLKSVNFGCLRCCTAIKMPSTIKISAIGEKMQSAPEPYFSYYSRCNSTHSFFCSSASVMGTGLKLTGVISSRPDSNGNFEVFRPTETTRLTYYLKIWHGGRDQSVPQKRKF